MPFAKTDDGCEIFYLTQGQGGPYLVFVSGYMGISDIWQDVISQLSTRYRCVSYDSRGYGRSSKPDEPSMYSIERHSLDLKSVLATLQVTEPVILITHSMGCNIASAFCLAFPQQVRGMVQNAPHYDGKALRDGGFTIEMLTADVHIPSKAGQLYIRLGLREELAVEAAQWPAYARRHNANAMLNFEMGDRYKDISVPVLLIQGDESGLRSIVDDLPRGTVHDMKSVSHFPPTEAASDVAQLVDEFAKSLS